jgi:hypothetical protein
VSPAATSRSSPLLLLPMGEPCMSRARPSSSLPVQAVLLMLTPEIALVLPSDPRLGSDGPDVILLVPSSSPGPRKSGRELVRQSPRPAMSRLSLKHKCDNIVYKNTIADTFWRHGGPQKHPIVTVIALGEIIS